ncbi:unnamed protein product [Prunus armeniaca]|uniref:Uncharacterized protein n=1 Tax=Prunus armeniaca TaxID=36596 RepID=A0A6J5VMX3_PRUAR|nr:unnamed protein product [Prunus armeniaca]
MVAVIAAPIARARMKIDHASSIYGFVSIAFRGQIINIKTEFSSLFFEIAFGVAEKRKTSDQPHTLPLHPSPLSLPVSFPLSPPPSCEGSHNKKFVPGPCILC